MTPKLLSPLDLQLLNTFQHNFPLVAEPYKEMAEQLGITELALLTRLKQFQDSGVVSRVGAVFKPRRVGISTLAAVSVPEDDIERVAALVNTYPEVNHNYEREHSINLWFVVTAANEQRLEKVLKEIEQKSGISVHKMPMVEDYHIDLGFPLHG